MKLWQLLCATLILLVQAFMPLLFQPDWPLSAFPMYKDGVRSEWVEGWEFQFEGSTFLNSIENKRASILTSLRPKADKSSSEFFLSLFTWKTMARGKPEQFHVIRYVCQKSAEQVCEKVRDNENRGH